MSRRSMLWGMVAVLLVAAALRLVAFGQVPPGLYHDEAYHGLDALQILEGNLSLYFHANNGREPLFIYLIASTVGLLGKSPFALRLPSFFVGMLTIAATAAMGRALFSRRVGLLAAAVLAVTVWHVHLSRVGFRAVLLPLFIALTAWQVALGVKGDGETGRQGSRGKWHWIVAGVFYGLSFYTYTAARFTPVALAVFGIYVLGVRSVTRNLQSPILRPCSGQASNPQLWRVIGMAGLAVLVVLVPLAIYTAGNLEVVLGRPGQVSVFNPTINGGDPWGTLGAHTLRTLGMFFVQGDRIWRHNVPWRPIFDPVLGGTFLLGAVVALRSARRDAATGFVLIWTAVMSLPTLLAEDAPHFLRAVGVLPVVVLLPALGLDWLAVRIGESASRRSLLLIPYSLLLFSLVSTTYTYFYDYAHDPVAGYWFQKGAATLAGRVNGFLGVGWDGERMARGESGDPSITLRAGRRVYLDPRLWEHWPSIQFLVAAPDAVTLGLLGPPPEGPVAIFTWPFEDWQWAWDLLPVPAEITFEEGPLSQGDRDPEPYATYLAFFATPPDTTGPAMARFSGGVELLGVEVSPTDGERLRVCLRWRATAPLEGDYTVFLHYLRDGERIYQADSQPVEGRYPTRHWRPGDVINDDHYVEGAGSPIPGRDAILFGFWEPESGAKLYLLDEAGNPAGDWMMVPVESLISNIHSPTRGQ